ncbi:multicopper oxidase domain-containing protein [Nitrosospira multiformis]|uniref:Multicopper oxidase n=1 Tax=Nitrosospira multiformis TaxID=1231 RepID=A0A1I7HSB4_9PROT|nr:multicopper oxidase domain-containing protein [Nitrosospira multiformis]SFU63560.1 Multicopper oxidase [Nitrosospira multiformis]
MKYQHSDAMEDFFASDLLRHSSITFSFKRFCGGLALPSVLWLTLLSLPMEESAAAEHRIEMAAEQLEDGVLAYRMVEHQVDKVNITSRYSKQATVPGPTIVLTEGDKVRLTIRNGISMSPDQQVSVHVHGVHYNILSDGSLKIINKIDNEGAYPDHGGHFYTYIWDVAPGTAGTWPYHDHNFETHNGAEDRGLYGAVIVNPASGTVTASNGSSISSIPVAGIRKDYVLYLSDDAFWGMEIDGATRQQTPLGANPLLSATSGDNVRFHLIAMGTYLNRFQLEGYQWVDPGTARLIGSKDIGPLENHAFTIKALGSANYMNANFSRKLMGMKGSFIVTNAVPH